MVLLSSKWPFLALFDPISSQSSPKVLSSMNSCRFFRFQDVFWHFEFGHAHNQAFYGKNSPVYGSSRFSPQARCFRSHFDFRCRVSHTTTVSDDEKSLASKLVWKGKSWPKVAVDWKAMIFLCFWGKSSVVFWSLSFRHHLQDLFALHRLTIKAFQGHLNWWRHKWNKTQLILGCIGAHWASAG